MDASPTFGLGNAASIATLRDRSVETTSRIALLFSCLALLSAPTLEARTRRTPSDLRDFSARVVKVRDGDSLEVQRGADVYDVRLARLDAPELHQARGEGAKQFTETKVLGVEVRIRAKTIDSYGRLIGNVTYRGGRSLNEEVVAAGWAWWYKRHYPRDQTMEALERRAREQRLGLWQEAKPTPPWQWRAQHPR